MAQDIALFGSVGGTIVAPAYIQEAFTETNIAERDTLPTLSLKGKVWAISVAGESSPLMKVDEDGEKVPVPSLMVVILDYAKQRGRSYYEGTYDPDNTSAPKCWSIDSVTPEDSVPEPISAKCNGCPMSVKGSRVSDNGKSVVACGQFRVLAVVPQKALDMPPLRFRIAITSDYDGQSKDLQAQGKFAFTNYAEFIKGKGVMHTAALVTRLSFDPAVAYPKVLFQASRWLNEAELTKVLEKQKSEGVAAILGTTHLIADKKALPKPEQAANTTQAQADHAAALKAEEQRVEAAKAEAERVAEAERQEKAAKAAAAKAKKEEKERKAAEAAKAPTGAQQTAAALAGLAGDGDDDGGDDDGDMRQQPSSVPTKPVTATKQVTEPQVAPGDVSPGLAGLLDSWSSDD